MRLRQQRWTRVACSLTAGFAILGICVLIASASASASSENLLPGPNESLMHGPGPDAAQINQATEAVLREEREREVELEQPRFQAEREQSRDAYSEADAAEATELLRSDFGEQLSELNADPGRFLSNARLDHSLGEGAAVVTSAGKTTLMEGPMPIKAENEEGEMEKVDLDLERSPEGFEPENPVVETVIGKTAEEGVELGGEEPIEVVQAGAEGDQAKLFGEQNVLFSEVEEGSDTDQLVSPTSTGVELFDLLRSADSPDTLHFHFTLPEGATIAPIAGGAAEIQNEEGTSLAVISKPTAVDAQGTEVPVSIRIEGDTVALVTRHREEDLDYPILVDPTVVYEDWEHPSWYENQRLESLSYWRWNSNVNWILHPTTDEQWPGHAGLFIAMPAGNLPGGVVGENYMYRNNATEIAGAYIGQFWRANQGCEAWQYPAGPYDFDGLYDVVDGGFTEYNVNAAATQGWSNLLHNWGHELVEGWETVEPASIPCWRDLMDGATELWWSDWSAPSIEVSGMPTGWVKVGNEPHTITVKGTDDGLGVQRAWMIGIGGREWNWNQPTCTGTLENQCAETRTGTISFETSGTSVYEGPQTVTVHTADPVEHVNSATFPISLDGLPPKLTFSGQFAAQTEEEGAKEQPQGPANELSLPVYNLKIAAEDGTAAEPRSGVRNVRIYMDGKLLETRGNSCSTSCPRLLEFTYPVQLTGLTEGKHTLEIGTEDYVGNKILPAERKIEFTYIPPTGMKEEYVLQHFALPDGHNYSEEPEYKGPELAVNVSSGNLVYRERSLKETAPDGSLELERVYNSQQPTAADGQWGHGWSITASPELRPEQTASTAVMSEAGAVTSGVVLPTDPGQEKFDAALRATVVKVGNAYEVSSETSSERTVFDSAGQVEEVQLNDPNVAGKTGGFVAAYGSGGTGSGQFSHPAGLAITHGGDLWVVDQNNHRLEELTQKGEYITSFGAAGSGTGQLSRPAAVALDAQGDLWVADAGNDRIEKFSQSGEYLGEFGSYGSGPGQFNGPEAIAVANGHVWVGDTYNGRLEEFSESGAFIKTVGSQGSGAGQMIEPTGVAVGPEGDVWVADWGRNRIEVFTEAGALVREFGTSGSGNGQFNRPDVLAVDDEGNVWVGDQNNDRIQEFGQAGEFKTAIGSGGNGPGQFSFGYPMGIAVDNAGHIWVSDTGNNRVQEWSIPGFVPGEAGPPPAIEYDYSAGHLSKMTLNEPYAQAEPEMTASVAGGLTTAVSSSSAGAASFSYSKTDLVAATSPEGTAKFTYNASKLLTKVELPNGTAAEIVYDTYSRVVEVVVKPEGGKEQITHFWYGSEPREARVWGNVNPEIRYSFGADGSLVYWGYTESPPKLVSITGSLWGYRDSNEEIENKTQTLFVHAESPHGIASIKVLIDGDVVEETTCEETSPPTGFCDQPEPLEWITSAKAHPAGKMNIEIIATDFQEHQTSESFFVIVPQQPPPNPEAPAEPEFESVKLFREEYGLDRNKSYTDAERNKLFLELIYEWEAGFPDAVHSVEQWGVPMRRPEIEEMEMRERYIAQAAQVIPEWAEEHAESTYGGYYVDNRAGGLIYVGFTANQATSVQELKQSAGLEGANEIFEYPVPPTTPIVSVKATESSVMNVILQNSVIGDATTSVSIEPGASVVRVGASNPSVVASGLQNALGSLANIEVVAEAEAGPAESRYKAKGPVDAGDYVAREGPNTGYCTAGFDAYAEELSVRGAATTKDFLLSAGHCFGLESRALRKSSPNSTEYVAIGQTRRTGLKVPNGAGGYPNVDASAILLSDPSYLSGKIYYGSPNTLLSVNGAGRAPAGTTICHSGVSSGAIRCGPVTGVGWLINEGYAHDSIHADAGIATGDSGGPVWNRETGEAVGLASNLSGVGHTLAVNGQEFTKAMWFTPLLPFRSRVDPRGALTELGLNIWTE